MINMKFSELEKQIMEEKDIFKRGELIMQITESDEVASNLARKVIRKDVQNLIDKLRGIFQRTSAECESTEGMTDISILIEWLKYIEE